MKMPKIDVLTGVRLALVGFVVLMMCAFLAMDWHDGTPIYAWAYPLVVAALAVYFVFKGTLSERERYSYPAIARHTLLAMVMAYFFNCGIDASGLWNERGLRGAVILGLILALTMCYERYRYQRRIKKEAELQEKIKEHKAEQAEPHRHKLL